MSVVQIRHIQGKLNDLYHDKIDMSDISIESNKSDVFYSRAYAAYTLQILASATIDDAAEAIVDGRDDNGIDAIYYDRKSKALWIVQSKWIKKGQGEPESGDTAKFCTGIRDLIDLELTHFNSKVRDKQDMIEDALNDYETKIYFVLSYTGSDSFSIHNKHLIDNLLKDVNDASEVAFFERFTLSQSHKSLSGLVVGAPINTDVAVENWGINEHPFKMLYGTVNGTYFAEIWKKYRSRLFSDNIRDFIGSTEVNDSIRNTIENKPQNFLYFNNGITILCQSFNKKPIALSRDMGQFEIKDLKIVNGAQTVGSIGHSSDKSLENLESVKVFVKIISLEDAPDGLGNSITQFTNTQNKIEKRDFISLDPEHERLRTELALDNISYQIKRSDSYSPKDHTCNVEDVIISVACSLKDVNLAVLAKREVGKLWEQVGASPYTDIINPKLTSTKAWRCVVIMRKVAEIIKEKTKLVSGRQKACYIHSNRFVLHILLNSLNPQVLLDPKYDFPSFVDNELSSKIEGIETKLFAKVEEKYEKSLIHQIFRNYTKCRELKEAF